MQHYELTPRQKRVVENARRAEMRRVESSRADARCDPTQILDLMDLGRVIDDAVEPEVARLSLRAKADAIPRTRKHREQRIVPGPWTTLDQHIERQLT